MLYAHDAGLVATSSLGLARMVDVIVVACQKFGLTVPEKKTEAAHLWSDPGTTSNALRYVNSIVYHSGAIGESEDLDTENKRRIGAA